jgi:hypothetical protein
VQRRGGHHGAHQRGDQQRSATERPASLVKDTDETAAGNVRAHQHDATTTSAEPIQRGAVDEKRPVICQPRRKGVLLAESPGATELGGQSPRGGMPRHDVEGGPCYRTPSSRARAQDQVVKELVELESAQRHKVHLATRSGEGMSRACGGTPLQTRWKRFLLQSGGCAAKVPAMCSGFGKELTGSLLA